MNIAFRVDGSPHIGGGHLSRCLTIANLIKKRGGNCLFVLREHQGSLSDLVTRAGHKLELLPLQLEKNEEYGYYESWVGASWQTDSAQSLRAINKYFNSQIDWLIVDHYGLDSRWENEFTNKGIKVGVIDDLVNRCHNSNFLLDQTCGRDKKEYKELVPSTAELFLGEKFCLLRDEFFSLRVRAIEKRNSFSSVQKVLINFGSTDPTGQTLLALKGIESYAKQKNVEVLLVIGSGCPSLEQIKSTLKSLHYKIKLYIDTNSVGELILDSDLCIGAAGASTWERCFLGLPTLLVKTAENQADVINRVISCNAAIGYIGDLDCESSLANALDKLENNFEPVSKASLQLDIGNSLDVFIKYLYGEKYE
ncbi:UDP-2,4-diacetamido-2,4,6-trideoxy-beta-L-altropyranose hydrolase [Pseudoalteromonas sp. FUC4]|uniref:UDP-2,4-diacetamido-2,4, 6-trideoxy-beta-L-altropyranose hydrolase n=1 Tax=Pseudoalteromonas sp. FUC4 TaxID=2511201 RepID=UPI0011F1657D|nr:UDP-2,4-diacetamido-2,4,6-trideoxy-beta-L-altropyranose hydrolase [Pseudoalteromonas sp. FUC4]KAA1152441.1 UDP-2,4-diacetamido-2,4,6-trideoxy-beta-L-altropyranose hydrolase [Pseudoalteromonas sp. FUC4]